ncbi:MAG: MATE family efflux transporter [Alphaproteobacteria bacterium]|nr:MATE family efflux transporter [Alphaproteobacteria bacterium]
MSMLLSPTLSRLWRISLPLMLTTLSANMMFLLDRLILVRYSAEAMNAVAVAGMSCAIFQFSGVAIASIAEVFVGQYNGSGQYEKTSQPVWQMIWFSLGLFLICWPIAFWAGPYVIPASLHKEGLPFFKLIMLFSPLISLIAALSAFFIGRGFVKLVTWCTLICNLINAALNVILVFGVEGWIPSLGTLGSAIATISAESIQILILGCVFLNKYHRKHFKTGYYQFNSKLWWDCLKIGTPSAISHMIEIAAWATLFQIAASVDLDYITIQTVGNSVLVFFAFVTEGIQKGVIAIASNLIGAKKDYLIRTLFKSGYMMHLIFVLAFAIPLIFYPGLIISQFLPGVQDPSLPLYRECATVLKLVWIYFLFDGIVWILSGILTAGGDTRFIMFMNASAAWIFAILPIYIAVHYFHVHSSTAWGLCTIYGAANLAAFFMRYRSNKWKKLVVDT